jgi:hypothetical protein
MLSTSALKIVYWTKIRWQNKPPVSGFNVYNLVFYHLLLRRFPQDLRRPQRRIRLGEAILLSILSYRAELFLKTKFTFY